MESWHGTSGGYTNHKCRCKKCKAAWAKYWNAAYRKVPKDICSHPNWVHAGKSSDGRREMLQCTDCGTRHGVGAKVYAARRG